MRIKYFIAALCLGGLATAKAADDDVQAIALLLGASFDRPEAKVVTAPVVIASGHALADWTQGAQAGRALLAKRDGQWQVLSCGGASLRHPDALTQSGVPADAAALLAHELARLEAQLPEPERRRFDTFDAAQTDLHHASPSGKH